jgi:hypothetical protein
MTFSIFRTPDSLPPIAAVQWTIRHALIVDTEAAAITALRGQMALLRSTDVDVAASADEALDTIGFVSETFDVILLGAGPARAAGLHVLSVLRRQRAPFVVAGYSFGAPGGDHPWSAYVGVATWLNLEDGERWPRRLAKAVEIGVTVEQVIGTGRVPWHLESDLAQAIYGSEPGERFTVAAAV